MPFSIRYPNINYANTPKSYEIFLSLSNKLASYLNN